MFSLDALIGPFKMVFMEHNQRESYFNPKIVIVLLSLIFIVSMVLNS
jgi:hypothetical protein